MTNAPYLLPKARGGYRLGHGQIIDHMFMDGLEDAYSKENRGRLMGTFAEECADQLRLHPRSAGRIRHPLDHPRQAGQRRRQLRLGNRPGHRRRSQGRCRHRQGRRPVRGQHRKDPDLEAGVQEGRHGHPGQFVVDLRRRRRHGADARLAGRQARPEPDRPHRRPHHPRPRAGAVPDRAGRRHAEIVRKNRVDRSRRRSVRNQRSLRRRHHGGAARSRIAGRQGQRPWRRLRARPPDRRFRRPHRRHAARRAEKARPEARRRLACASAAAKRRRSRWKCSKCRSRPGPSPTSS